MQEILPAGFTGSQAQSLNRPLLAHFPALSWHPSVRGPPSDLSSNPQRGERAPRRSSPGPEGLRRRAPTRGARGASTRGSLQSPRGRVVCRERARVREGGAG